MKTKILLTVVVILMLSLSYFPKQTLASSGDPNPSLIANLKTALLPGVAHAWSMGPSSNCGAYLVEVSPLKKSLDGAYIERAEVQPEFDGSQWNDILRVQIPDWMPKLKVNIRVYRFCNNPVVMDFTETLIAGEWMGWVVGPVSEDRGYLVEVSPIGPSIEGARIWKSIVQQEYFTGDWQDVLRLQTPQDQPDQLVHVRVFEVSRAPIIVQYETVLEPGVWTGYSLGASKNIGWYVVEINPIEIPMAGEFVEILKIQPEFDGNQWSDVLRLQAVSDQPSIHVQVRVYSLTH